MAEQKYYNVKESGRGRKIDLLKRYLALEVESISTDDFIIVSQLGTVNEVTAIDLTTPAIYECIVDGVITNKVTLTEATVANAHIIILAVGE